MLFSYAVIQFSQEFFYAVSNPIIPFRILLFIFLILLCHYEFFLFSFQFFYSLSNYVMQFSVQSYYSTVQSSHVVSNPVISFQILLVTLPILLCHYEFFYSVSNSIIRFRIMFFQIRDFVYLADGALGTSNKLISRV